MLSTWRRVRVNQRIPSLCNLPQNQTLLENAKDIAWYSNSLEDLETQSCFLLFQKIIVSPRNIHQPITESRVLG